MARASPGGRSVGSHADHAPVSASKDADRVAAAMADPGF